MVLIANVGNRNLLYQGVQIPDWLRGKHTSFRALTQELLQKEVYDEIELNILDVMLHAHHASLDRLILIATDQRKGKQQEQDTIYAAGLIREKITRKAPWAHIEIQIETMPVSLERTSEVMNWYKRFLYRTKSTYPDSQFLICDAGGAPQMKTPLKIMAEFILPADRYHVEYVQHVTGDIVEVEQLEYRKVIASYQISSLLPTLDYRAARKLWQGISPLAREKDPTYLLIRFAELRSGLLLAEAKSAAQSYINKAKKTAIPEARAYAQGKFNGTNRTILDDALVFQAGEYLALCQWYESADMLNELVLSARQFQEYVLAAVLDDTMGIPMLSNHASGRMQLLDYCKKHNLMLGDEPIYSDSVPVRTLVANHGAPSDVRPILDSFARIDSPDESGNHQKTLGALRNSLAHRGVAVTATDLSQRCPHLRKEVKLWGEILQRTENPYAAINRALMHALEKA